MTGTPVSIFERGKRRGERQRTSTTATPTATRPMREVHRGRWAVGGLLFSLCYFFRPQSGHFCSFPGEKVSEDNKNLYSCALSTRVMPRLVVSSGDYRAHMPYSQPYSQKCPFLGLPGSCSLCYSGKYGHTGPSYTALA